MTVSAPSLAGLKMRTPKIKNEKIPTKPIGLTVKSDKISLTLFLVDGFVLDSSFLESCLPVSTAFASTTMNCRVTIAREG